MARSIETIETNPVDSHRNAAYEIDHRPCLARHKLQVGYSGGTSLLPFIGCVSKNPARKNPPLVTAIDTSAEFHASIPTLSLAEKHRTLADLKLFASYWLCTRDREEVYFLQATGKTDALIKIGFSRDPWIRARAVQDELMRECGVYIRLAVRASIPGNRLLEQYIHAAFNEFREFGEWFHPADPILSIITEIRAEQAAA